MKNRFGSEFRILLLITIASAFVFVGCGDEGNSTTSTSTSSGSSSSGAGGSGGSGGSAVIASPGTELASGGDVVKSSKYKMVINFGGSTPAPGNATSPQHRLHGGLVGVTEGTK